MRARKACVTSRERIRLARNAVANDSQTDVIEREVRQAHGGLSLAFAVRRSLHARPGTAASSSRVYAWRGCAKTLLVEPISTISPCRITAIESHTCAATRRSCVMKSIVRPRGARESRLEVRSTCSCTETSSAETSFIRDQNLGVECQCACEPDALALTAGELVRITGPQLRVSNPTSSEQFERARCNALAAGYSMDDWPFCDEVT